MGRNPSQVNLRQLGGPWCRRAVALDLIIEMGVGVLEMESKPHSVIGSEFQRRQVYMAVGYW